MLLVSLEGGFLRGLFVLKMLAFKLYICFYLVFLLPFALSVQKPFYQLFLRDLSTIRRWAA